MAATGSRRLGSRATVAHPGRIHTKWAIQLNRWEGRSVVDVILHLDALGTSPDEAHPFIFNTPVASSRRSDSLPPKFSRRGHLISAQLLSSASHSHWLSQCLSRGTCKSPSLSVTCLCWFLPIRSICPTQMPNPPIFLMRSSSNQLRHILRPCRSGIQSCLDGHDTEELNFPLSHVFNLPLPSQDAFHRPWLLLFAAPWLFPTSPNPT